MNIGFKRSAVIVMACLGVSALLAGAVLHSSSNSGQRQTAPDKAMSEADEWYLPTEDKAARLYVYEIGNGEPVVVLHGGFGAEHSYLFDAVRGLEDRFHFVFYDQRGSLRSPCPKDAITIQKHVEDLEQLRQSLNLEKVNLFAHSAGTILAMCYLQKYPDHVKNVVLAGAVDPQSGKQYFTAEELAAFKQKDVDFDEFRKRRDVQADLDKEGINQATKTPKQMTHIWRIKFAAANMYHVDRWRQMKGGQVFYNPVAGQATGESLPEEYDFAKVLARHPFPITVINGEYDYVVGPKGSPTWKKLCASQIRNVDLVIIDKAGHCVWLDDPVAFKNALSAGLSKRTQ